MSTCKRYVLFVAVVVVGSFSSFEGVIAVADTNAESSCIIAERSCTNAERRFLSKDMSALLESGKGADVTLVVGDKELPAHSQILAARSTVFAAMMQNDIQEARSRRIEITDIREDVVREMLSFIYSDKVAQLESIAAELLAAAEKYDLPLLKLRCEQQLIRDLSVEHAANTAGLAELYRCPELRKAAVQFIGRHPEVLASAGWGRLMQENAETVVEISRQLADVVQPNPPTEEELRNRNLSEEQKQILSRVLIAAAGDGRTGEVRDLLDAGVPVDGEDGGGYTALHKAVLNGHADIAKCLIDAGADVNGRYEDGATHLHAAAWHNHYHIVWMLLSKSAKLDVQNNDGETALHQAAKQGHVLAIEALLLAGARKDIPDNNGLRPISVATSAKQYLFY